MGKHQKGQAKQQKRDAKLTPKEKEMAAHERASSQKYQRGDEKTLKASLKVRLGLDWVSAVELTAHLVLLRHRVSRTRR